MGGKEALRKVAEYQLPFPGAWAVKIIQSILASAGTHPIRVDLTTTEIRFYFVATGFSLDEFETAYYNPEPPPNRGLRHLLSGLWSVGLKERWGFQIAFPRQTKTLIWDGEQMNRVESPLARDCTCISIAPLQNKEGLSWVAGFAMSGSRNAELLLVLSRFCYTCPLPLTVDGRRIDSLQRAENHGWSKETYPLTIGFAEAPLPELRLPPGTFSRVTKSVRHSSTLFEEGNRDGGGWRQVAEKSMRALSPQENAAVAFVVCVNMKLVESGRSYTWNEGAGSSTLYWVLDGALVGQEPLLSRNTHCSLGCFLSAEGLQTDLSTFHLLESSERAERKKLACLGLVLALDSVDQNGFQDLVTRGKLMQRIVGGALVAGGLWLLWPVPVLGLGGIAAGGLTILKAGNKQEAQVQSAQASLRELTGRLRTGAYGTGRQPQA